MNENVLAFLVGVLWAINPTIAFGAAIGAIILINTIEERFAEKKYTFGVIGGLVGYFTAIPFVESKYGFLIALLSASLTIASIVSLRKSINANKKLPEWMSDIVGLLGDLLEILRGRR